MNRFEYVRAESVAEAVAALGERGAVLKAGGVDLVDRLKEGLVAPRRVVSLEAADLRTLRDDARGGLHVGALVTLAALEASPIVRGRYAALAQAAGHVATPQIRNQATAGGNLLQRPRCWYFRHADFHCRKKGGTTCYAQHGEHQLHAISGNGTCAIVHPSTLATALVALGAKVTLSGPRGPRTMALERFFSTPEHSLGAENVLAADEVLTALHLPAPAIGTRSVHWKQGEKESFDWAIAEAAVVLELAGRTCKRASIVLGAMAPVPVRARASEAMLQGKAIDAALAAEAARAAVAKATPLARNGYKVPVFEAVVARAILAAAGGAA